MEEKKNKQRVHVKLAGRVTALATLIVIASVGIFVFASTTLAKSQDDFPAQACTVLVHIEGSGSVIAETSDGRSQSANTSTNVLAFTCGKNIKLTAGPDGLWRFSEWQNVSPEQAGKASITVTAPAEVTAVFLPRASRLVPVETPFYDRNGQLVDSIHRLEPLNSSFSENQLDTQAASSPDIDLWYGNYQQFGQQGTPQEWINILGNVSDADGDLTTLSYVLNDGTPVPLSYGGDGSLADGRRLWNAGDINIDIDKDDLLAGDNDLQITAFDAAGSQSLHQMAVNWSGSTTWPLPHTISWADVSSIEDEAQIIDGKWELTGAGIRPLETGYDRAVGIGQGPMNASGWSEFEVLAEVTVHGYEATGYQAMQGAPSLGIVARWQGHTDIPVVCPQPKCGWLPVGAAAWYSWEDENSTDANFSIWTHNAGKKYDTSNLMMEMERPYYWKLRVDNTVTSRGKYYLKVWPTDSSEPESWLMTFDDSQDNKTQESLTYGSVLLLAHHVDVTFGDIQISPLGETSDVTPTTSTTQPSNRVTSGLVALYDFKEGSDSNKVYDVSGVGSALNLTIAGGSTSWLPGGGLSINNSADIATVGAAAKIIQAAQGSNALTIETWIAPSNTTQDGPARILTLSDSSTTRNFTLGQGLWGSKPSTVYDVRLRTSQTDNNGQPSLSTNSGTAKASLQQVVITFSGGNRKIYIDGVLVKNDKPNGDFSNWDTTYPLRLANEATGDRPWLGEFHLAAFYDRALTAAEVAQNFQAGSSGEQPTPTNTPVGPTPTNTPVGPTPTSTPTATPNSGSGDPIIYVSSSSNGTAKGLSFADEDILAFNANTGSWSMFIDGSDVGLTGNGYRDINAFHILQGGSMLFSVLGPTTIPDVGSVDDSDIIHFIPTSTGANTAGTFSLFFDGSDVDLSTNGEDIDALTVLSDGKLLISTIGSATVGTLRSKDEDLLLFAPTGLGSNTSGTWSFYFDGSDVGLGTSGSEDVWAVWASDTDSDIFLSTSGAFNVSGAAGDGADILRCGYPSTGNNTDCTYDTLWDGSANSFANEVIDGMHIVGAEDISPLPPPPPPAPTPTPTATPDGSGGGGTTEMIVYDWNTPVTVAHRGFPRDKPPIANGDWTEPINFAEGTLYYHVEIYQQPVVQDMKIQFCVWQEKNGNNHGLENCGAQTSVRGSRNNVVTWSQPVQEMWKKKGNSIEWDRPRFNNGAAIKNINGKPVSDYNNWNWNGEEPNDWYPLDWRFTVVAVAKGETFSGWSNYD